MIKTTKKNLTLILTMLMGPISLLMLVMSVYMVQPKVEAKLTNDVQSVLESNNIKADVSFSGRDGVIQGEVDSLEESANAEKLSNEVFGTRVIRNRLVVKPTEFLDQHNPVEAQDVKQASNETAVTDIVEQKIPEQALPVEESVNPNILDEIVLANNQLDTAGSKPQDIYTYAGAADKKNNISSEVDKIMANMQKQSLQKNSQKPLTKETQSARDNPQTVTNDSVTQDKVVKSEESTVAKGNSNPKSGTNTTEKQVEMTSGEVVSEQRVETQNETSMPNEWLNVVDDLNFAIEKQIEKIAPQESSTDVKPPKKQATAQLALSLSDMVFTKRSAELSETAKQRLNKLVDKLNTMRYSDIELVVVTNDSDVAYQRGVSIRSYLAEKGIVKRVMRVSGKTTLSGEAKQITALIN